MLYHGMEEYLDDLVKKLVKYGFTEEEVKMSIERNNGQIVIRSSKTLCDFLFCCLKDFDDLNGFIERIGGNFSQSIFSDSAEIIIRNISLETAQIDILGWLFKYAVDQVRESNNFCIHCVKENIINKLSDEMRRKGYSEEEFVVDTYFHKSLKKYVVHIHALQKNMSVKKIMINVFSSEEARETVENIF